jgi:hypothetical protein
MAIFFSASTKGFYEDWCSYIPEDAVEITEEKRQEMLEGEAHEAKTISADENGHPILIDRI